MKVNELMKEKKMNRLEYEKYVKNWVKDILTTSIQDLKDLTIKGFKYD